MAILKVYYKLTRENINRSFLNRTFKSVNLNTKV